MHRVAFIHTRNNDDEVIGSAARDVILGGSGSDVLNGYDGNDVLQGGDNADKLHGDNGNDLLLGYGCEGPNANCSLFSNNGSEDDDLNGGPGNDCLDGGRGNDTVSGGAGGDAFVLFDGPNSDTVTDYNQADGDVIVDLTGSGATANWEQGKRGAPSICEVATGGNGKTIIENVSKGQCEAAGVVVYELPAQCTGHPATY